MARTTANAVKAVLMADYDSAANPSLAPFIDEAASLVRRMIRCALAKGFTHDAEDLELIERRLAAHCYAMSDQPYSSKSTLRASGAFQGKTGMYLETTKYGMQAILLDGSGCLAAIGQTGKQQIATGFHLGKPESEQLSYDERNGT